MAPQKRRMWYPLRVKRRKKQLAARAVAASCPNSSSSNAARGSPGCKAAASSITSNKRTGAAGKEMCAAPSATSGQHCLEKCEVSCADSRATYIASWSRLMEKKRSRRRKWYPLRAKTRKKKLAEEALRCRDGVATAKPALDGRGSHDNVTIDGNKTEAPAPPAAALAEGPHEAVLLRCPVSASTTVAAVPLPLLRSSETCVPRPVRWYHLGQPLLATRVRELFSRPLLNYGVSPAAAAAAAATASENVFVDTTPSSSSLCTLSHGDEEALSWLFPAVHNGEWFATPWAFIDHCRSVSHKLLCENVALFPLVVSRRRRGHATTEAALQVDNNAYGAARNDDIAQDTYNWWFMRIHSAVSQFALQEWHGARVMPGCVDGPAAWRRVYEEWCGCRVFQAAVAAAVARQLASTTAPQWHTVSEAAAAIARIVRDVYVCIPPDTRQLRAAGRSDGSLAACSCMPLETLSLACVETHTAAAAAAVAAASPGVDAGPTLAVWEAEAIAALSVHLALTLADTHGREGDAVASLRQKAEGSLPSPSCSSPRAAVSADAEVEERIMALVVWLHLRDAAAGAT